LVIADVAGHGVGAAFIMTETRTFIRSRAQWFAGADETLRAINEFLFEDLDRAELFITMFYLRFEAATGRLAFANAGHPPPIVWRAASETCERLDAEGLILGVRKEIRFEEKRAELHPGDLLLLFTDGVTEAENPEGGFFGEERLFTLMQDLHVLPPDQLIEQILQRVRLFTGSRSFGDDVSLVAMRVEP
jgi:serine phosphatase RsbU (regulator of sigma subunit)